MRGIGNRNHLNNRSKHDSIWRPAWHLTPSPGPRALPAPRSSPPEQYPRPLSSGIVCQQHHQPRRPAPAPGRPGGQGAL